MATELKDMLRGLVSEKELAQTFEQELRDPAYQREIGESRKQMIDGETIEWKDPAQAKR